MIRERKASTDDRKIYQLIKDELLPFTHRSFPNMKVGKREISLRMNRGKTFVESDKKGVKGFVLCEVRYPVLWVDMLAIENSTKGKGVGSSLLRTAEQYGLENRCSSAMLYVDEQNYRAQNFYLRRGYGPTRYVPELKCYLYVKNIQYLMYSYSL